MSEKCDDLQESRGAGTRGCASSRPARWQRGGQRNQRRKRPLPVPKSARVVSGRQYHRLRMLVDHLMCRGGRSKESLLAKISDCSWVVPSICAGAHAPSGRTCRNRRCPVAWGSSASPWFTASGCSGGSLAVIQPLWFQKLFAVSSMLEEVATAHAGAFPTGNAGTSLGRHCSTAHPSQAASHVSVLADDVRASVRGSGVEEERKILSHRWCHFSLAGWLCSQLPKLECQPRRVRDGSVLMDQRWLQWVSSFSYPHPRRDIGRTGISIALEHQVCSTQQPFKGSAA